jgi:hypothetical protein
VAELASLLAELEAAHDDFLQALSEVDADLVTTPGVMEDWSVRDLVVHVAAWSEHGASALELAATGRGGEFAYSKADTDAMNARFLSAGRDVTPAAALRREAEAFAAFRGLLAGLEPSHLDLVLGNGDTVEAVVRYDGPDHYAEHTTHLRAWFGAEDEVEVDEPADV